MVAVFKWFRPALASGAFSWESAPSGSNAARNRPEAGLQHTIICRHGRKRLFQCHQKSNDWIHSGFPFRSTLANAAGRVPMFPTMASQPLRFLRLLRGG